MKQLIRELKLFKRNYEIFLLTLPGLLYILIFAYLPMGGIIIAFKNYTYDKGILGSEWVGLKNFEFFFVSDTALRVTRNTVLYNAGYIAITTITALVLALLLNEISRKYLKFYQTSLLLPHFLSWILVSYIGYVFLEVNNGFVNQLLDGIGIGGVNWYMESWPWPYILNIANLWKGVGFAALIYYAGILGIDSEYYEAAKMDGATRFQMMWKITLPMLTTLIIILFILSIGAMFRGDFGLHYFMTQNSTFTYPSADIIDTYVFRALRTLGDVSMSAAVGVYQSIVGLVLVLASNYIVKKINSDNSLW
ncbi:ABC transporter permease [Paenibacillus silvisoli]|uniref:ABC transporter permease n=1 Tax=Paenibacillus silvisoli TaxID=3110539 RepID=UPI002803EA16|nr:ABC transporter permease subunit [Paenibacillus silvisoli]